MDVPNHTPFGSSIGSSTLLWKILRSLTRATHVVSPLRMTLGCELYGTMRGGGGERSAAPPNDVERPDPRPRKDGPTDDRQAHFTLA